MINAHKRGVHIEVVADPAQFKDRYSKISLLQESGIPVYEYDPNYVTDMRSNIMHHKFSIFGISCVMTGSYNWTGAARDRNQENGVIIKNRNVAAKFEKQFERLKERCVHCRKKNRSRHMAKPHNVIPKNQTLAWSEESRIDKKIRNKKVKIV